MEKFTFYEIKSEKLDQLDHGKAQRVFSCSGRAGLFCYLWLSLNGDVEQFQMIFDEKIIEWSPDKKWRVAITNRALETIEKIGIQKGVRTIHYTDNDRILKEGKEILENATFPDSGVTIMKRLLEEV